MKIISLQWMVNGLSGRRSASVARPVVQGRKLVPAPAPTHRPQEAGRNVKERPLRLRTVTLENAEVWRLSIAT